MSESQDHSDNPQRELVIDHTIYNLPELLTLLDHPFTEEERQQVQAAESAFLNQDFEKALALFLELLPVLENYSDFHLHLGKAYGALNNEIAAYNHLRQALKLNPNCWRVNNNLGIFYKNQKQYDKALMHYQQALKCNPEISAVYGNLGSLYSVQGKSELAMENFLKGLALAPNSIAFHQVIASEYYTQENHERALLHMEKVLELKPDDYESMYLLGIYYGDQKKWQKQYNLYEQNLGLARNQEDLDELYWRMGIAAVALNWQEKANHCISKYIETNQNSTRHSERLAELSLVSQQQELAIPFYEKLVELDPDNVSHWANLIQFYSNIASKDAHLKALEYAQKGMKKNVLDSFFIRTVTYNLMIMEGGSQEALPYLEQALIDEPNNPDLHYLKGLALEKLNQWEKTLPLFQIALKTPHQDDNFAYRYYVEQMALLAEKHQETAFAKACRKRLMQLNQLHNESS